MAAARWKVLALDGTVVWGVYDDVTDEMIGFEIQNPGRLTVRLIMRRTARPDTDVERDPREPVKVAIDASGSGKRIVERDGEINLPDGLAVIVESIPTR